MLCLVAAISFLDLISLEDATIIRVGRISNNDTTESDSRLGHTRQWVLVELVSNGSLGCHAYASISLSHLPSCAEVISLPLRSPPRLSQPALPARPSLRPDLRHAVPLSRPTQPTGPAGCRI